MFPYSFGALINDKFLFVQPNPIHSQTLFSRAFGLFLWKGRMNATISQCEQQSYDFPSVQLRLSV